VGFETWMLVAIAGWLTVTVVVGLYAWALARAAAIGDRPELEQMDQRAVEADLRTSHRRVGPEDRRDAIRPWAVEATGRRAEDALRRNLAEAKRIEIGFGDFTWSRLEEQASRQGVSVEELVSHAVLYFLADLDPNRIARRVPRLGSSDGGSRSGAEGKSRRSG